MPRTGPAFALDPTARHSMRPRSAVLDACRPGTCSARNQPFSPRVLQALQFSKPGFELPCELFYEREGKTFGNKEIA